MITSIYLFYININSQFQVFTYSNINILLKYNPVSSLVWRDRVPRPLSQCSLLASQQQAARDHRSDARLRIDAKVLVIVESAYTRLGRDIAELLVANRIR